MTLWNQTLASSPRTTSPTTIAEGASQALAGTTGLRPQWGRMVKEGSEGAMRKTLTPRDRTPRTRGAIHAFDTYNQL
jgi:hypothetical protein